MEIGPVRSTTLGEGGEGRGGKLDDVHSSAAKSKGEFSRLAGICDAGDDLSLGGGEIGGEGRKIVFEVTKSGEEREGMSVLCDSMAPDREGW